MRSPITEVIERYNALTYEQQKVFLDLVDPQPEPEPTTKQARKKRGPSKRAQSLSAAIGKTPKAEADADAPTKEGWCVAKIPGLDVVCGDPADNKVHDPNGGYAGYHEFEAPKATKKAAGK